MATTKKLTKTEFDSIRPHLTNKKQRTIDIAFGVLVEGNSQTSYAEKFGITTKAVSQMVKSVWEVFLEHGKRPKDWVPVDVVLPPAMAEAVKEMEKAALSQVKGKKQ